MEKQYDTDLRDLLASNRAMSWLCTRAGGRPSEFDEKMARTMISSAVQSDTSTDEWLRASLECLRDPRMFGYSIDTLARYVRCSSELLDQIASDPSQVSVNENTGSSARLRDLPYCLMACTRSSSAHRALC